MWGLAGVWLWTSWPGLTSDQVHGSVRMYSELAALQVQSSQQSSPSSVDYVRRYRPGVGAEP
jgi:hypothetical protein